MRKHSQHINNKILLRMGDAIRALRVDRELSQGELGERCGVHRTYITEIENGLRNISVLTLFSIAEGLEVQPHIILGLDDIAQ